MRLPPRSAAWAVVVLALTAGCSSAGATAPSAASSTAPSSSGATAETSAPAKPAAAAAADLTGSADQRPASLAVSVTGPEQGVPPVTTTDGPLSSDCRLDPAATEFATLRIVFTDPTPPTKQTGFSSNLRFDVTTAGGRDVGVVVDTATPSTYCGGSSALPASSELQSQNLADEHQTMTAYVVARTTAAVPHPLQGITAQLRGLRHHADSIDSRNWTWNVQRVTAGSACADDPNSLCVPLG
jgi:hypothetical protein